MKKRKYKHTKAYKEKRLTRAAEQFIKKNEPTEEDKAKKLDEAVKLLNRVVSVKIAPSKIAGVGVVALRNIEKGEVLELDAIPHAFDLPFSRFGELHGHVRDILLGHWPQVVNGSHFLYPVTKMTAFLNHSDDPNVDAKEGRALRDIAAGEELTEDYRQIDNWQLAFPWLNEK